MTHTTSSPILIDIPMPIRTPRLVIRNILPGDGEQVQAAKNETWDILKKWMPFGVMPIVMMR